MRPMRRIRRCPFSIKPLPDRLIHLAGVAELADALDSKSSDRKVVEVQVLSPVLEFAVLFASRFSFVDGVLPKVLPAAAQRASAVSSALRSAFNYAAELANFSYS
jgi:hypothetical protein